jgi:hypothetical protein
MQDDLDLHLQDYEKHILSKILNVWREHNFEKLANLCHIDPLFHKCKIIIIKKGNRSRENAIYRWVLWRLLPYCWNLVLQIFVNLIGFEKFAGFVLIVLHVITKHIVIGSDAE